MLLMVHKKHFCYLLTSTLPILKVCVNVMGVALQESLSKWVISPVKVPTVKETKFKLKNARKFVLTIIL